MPNAIVTLIYSDSSSTGAMAVERTLKRATPKRASGRAESGDLRRCVFRELADADPHDLPTLLRGLGNALRIASAILPATTPEHRDVWEPQERETYRSRATWETWLLRQKFPRLEDCE